MFAELFCRSIQSDFQRHGSTGQDTGGRLLAAHSRECTPIVDSSAFSFLCCLKRICIKVRRQRKCFGRTSRARAIKELKGIAPCVRNTLLGHRFPEVKYDFSLESPKRRRIFALFSADTRMASTAQDLLMCNDSLVVI